MNVGSRSFATLVSPSSALSLLSSSSSARPASSLYTLRNTSIPGLEPCAGRGFALLQTRSYSYWQRPARLEKRSHFENDYYGAGTGYCGIGAARQQFRMASKITDWVKPGDESGEFKRQTSAFRNWISSEPGAKFPAEKGRYHLYVSYACPWATRTLIVRKLKGLEDFISFSSVHWHMAEKGWRFPTAEDKDAAGENVIPDPAPGHEGYTHLRDLYFAADPDYGGRFTVPVLFDKKANAIVNNESSDILRMLGHVFDDQLPEQHRGIDLYPEHLRARIEEAHAWTYDGINNGVYKSGFATTQEAYERNVTALFDALDRAERHLAKTGGPFFFGDQITEVDVRLFPTLIRFDPVYVQHFKCNIRDIRSGYPRLHAYTRGLYWRHPAFRDTTNFLHIKNHYTRSHTQINPHAITPLGPVPDILPLDGEVEAVRAALASL